MLSISFVAVESSSHFFSHSSGMNSYGSPADEEESHVQTEPLGSVPSDHTVKVNNSFRHVLSLQPGRFCTISIPVKVWTHLLTQLFISLLVTFYTAVRY